MTVSAALGLLDEPPLSPNYRCGPKASRGAITQGHAEPLPPSHGLILEKAFLLHREETQLMVRA